MADAPTAVMKLNAHRDEAWYNTKWSANAWTPYTNLQGFFPFAVVAEGFHSTPRYERVNGELKRNLVEYRWDWGDDSGFQYGFTGFHVYETPGTYTVTLRVTDRQGRTSETTETVTVLDRTGTVYYVDADAGDDANDGLSEGTAWKTFTKVYAQMGLKTFDGATGKRVRLKRGCTNVYDFEPRATYGHYATGSRYLVDTYGEGAKPVIRRKVTAGNANATSPLLWSKGFDNWNHCSFVDLEFDGTAPTGEVGDIFIMSGGRIAQILFLRCDFKNGYQQVGFNGYSATDASTGCHLADCTFQNAGNLAVYCHAARFTMTGCAVNGTASHGLYGSFVRIGRIGGTTMQNVSTDRTCIRVSGSSDSADYPSRDVSIRDNVLVGTQNPGTGAWSWVMVEIAPNTPDSFQTLQDMEFTGNTISDCLQFLFITAGERIFAWGNTFASSKVVDGVQRIVLNARFAHRPLKDIYVEDNAVTCGGLPPSNRQQRIFSVNAYTAETFQGEFLHKDIYVRGNTVAVADRLPWGMYFNFTDPVQRAQIHHQNTWVGINRATDKVVRSGLSFADPVNPALDQTLDEVFAATGNEAPTAGRRKRLLVRRG